MINKIPRTAELFSTVVTIVCLAGVFGKAALVFDFPGAQSIQPIVGIALCLAVVYAVVLQIKMDVFFPLVKWSDANDFKSKFLCLSSRIMIVLYVISVFIPYDRG